MVSKGKLGLYSLVNLLLCLEAKHFILTLSSNWSRLINELRKTKLSSLETTMVDLNPGATSRYYYLTYVKYSIYK